MTKYERYVIRPILSVIEKHQDFLCKPENLPQLAKLGFMFDKLWYAGRVCYGHNGRIKKGGYTCENNPKYELGDTITYNSEENENLIYDAWGMHVSNDGNTMNYDEFRNLILNGKQLSEFELRYRKPNKTFDQWVEVLCDNEFQYNILYPDRKSVANHLLCVIGNGYGYNKTTGLVIREASGADQDEDQYGAWENSVFIPEIQEVVIKILDFDMCKIALDEESKYILALHEEEEEKEKNERIKMFGDLLPVINEALIKKGKEAITIDSPKFLEILDKFIYAKTDKMLKTYNPEKKESYHYYPICEYSIITMFDKNTHSSYITAGVEICEDIVKYPEMSSEKNNNKDNLKFAKEFLAVWKPN